MTSLFLRGDGGKIEESFMKVVTWRVREVLKSQRQTEDVIYGGRIITLQSSCVECRLMVEKGEKGLDNQATSE